MPNHAHFLLRTGTLPLSLLMNSWLSSYVTAFNRNHHRSGYLFQNRFKSILVEEHPYLLELVRYIHLNPVRSRMPVTLDDLDRYAWTGHAVLLGNREFPAQDTDFVLVQFDNTVRNARRAYHEFVRDGLRNGETDLEGGGLRRSSGGWRWLGDLRRGRERWAFDERILGGGEFVSDVLARAESEVPLLPPPDPLRALTAVCDCMAAHLGVTVEEIASSSLRRPVLDARALVSHLAVRRYGLSTATVARQLRVSRQSIARGLQRADMLLIEKPDILDGMQLS